MTRDIELERQMVEEQEPDYTSDEQSVEEEHREAQESGEVFEGGFRGDGR